MMSCGDPNNEFNKSMTIAYICGKIASWILFFPSLLVFAHAIKRDMANGYMFYPSFDVFVSFLCLILLFSMAFWDVGHLPQAFGSKWRPKLRGYTKEERKIILATEMDERKRRETEQMLEQLQRRAADVEDAIKRSGIAREGTQKAEAQILEVLKQNPNLPEAIEKIGNEPPIGVETRETLDLRQRHSQ